MNEQPRDVFRDVAAELSRAEAPHTWADLRGAGVTTRPRLGGWVRVYRDRYKRFNAEPSVADRILLAASVVPEGGAITGWAANYLHGATWADGGGPEGTTPVDIAVGTGGHRTSRDGVRFRREDPGPLHCRNGIVTVDPARAAVDAARFARTEIDATIAFDCVLSRSSVSRAELEAMIGLLRGRHGIKQARRALDLAHPYTWSPQETRLRLLAVAAGLPAPLPNQPIFDRHGRLLAIADLFVPDAALVLECDSDWHAGADRRADDAERTARLNAANIVEARAAGSDLDVDAPATASRFKAAYRAGLGRDRSLDAWTLDLPAWFPRWAQANLDDPRWRC